MAGETLRTVEELLTIFPDNVSGQIQAVHERDLIYSMAAAVGYLHESDQPFTVTTEDGVWVSINAAITNPGFVGNFWAIDANAAFIPGYPSGVSIAPGTERLVDITSTLAVDGTPGQPYEYSWQWFRGAQPIGREYNIAIENDTHYVLLSIQGLYDISVGEPLYLSVRANGHAQPVSVLDMQMKIASVNV